MASSEPETADGSGPSAASDGKAEPAPEPSWFLPAGRAGLLPDALVTAPAEEDPVASRQTPEPVAQSRALRSDAEPVGAPPWDLGSSAAVAGVAPPWESGPWPDPADSLAGGTLGPTTAVGTRQPGDHEPATDGRRRNGVATGALIAGVAGIAVLPGVVLGIVGLRRARVSGVGRVRSVLGILLSVAWAVGIGVVLTAGSPGRDPGCSGFARAGARVSASALGLLSGSAHRGSVLAAVDRAIGELNSEAAVARSVGVRDALAATVNDLQVSLARVLAGGRVPASTGAALRQDLAVVRARCAA